MARRMASVGTVTVSLRRSTRRYIVTRPTSRRHGGGLGLGLRSGPGTEGGQPAGEGVEATAVHGLAALALALTPHLGCLRHQAPVGVHGLETVRVGAR